MHALEPMFIFVLLMLVGYLIAKWGFLSDKAQGDLSSLVTRVALPALILSSVTTTEDIGSRAEAIQFLGIAFLAHILFIIASFIYVKLFNTNKENQGIVQFLLTFNNVGFIGLPLIQMMYGSEATFYAALMNIPFHVFSFSFGIWVMTRSQSDNQQPIDVQKLIKNPGLIAAILAVVFFFIEYQPHPIINELLGQLAALSTPLSMLVIGLSMAEIDLKAALKQKEVCLLMVVKMVVLPIIVYLVFNPLIQRDELVSVLVILSAMPGSASATSFAYEYGTAQQANFATQYIFVSNIFSMILVPLLLTVLGLY